MQYKNNILYTNEKEVLFDFPIKQVVTLKTLYLVLISPPNNLEYPSNIFGVNKEGDITWRIKSFNQEQIIFDKIDFNLNNGKVYGIDINYFKYVIDCETGDIISGKLRPLDEDIPSTQKKESQMNSKNSLKENKNFNLLKNNKFLTLMLFIGFFIFMTIFTKNIKINTLQTEIERLETYTKTLEETLIKQELIVQEKENTIKQLENYIVQNKGNTSIIDTNKTQISTITEEIPLIEQETTSKNNKTKEVDGGISTVVDFIDTLINNVSTGTAITTEDVKEMTKEVKEGYYVTQIIDGQRIKVSLDGQEEFVVKLISVSNCSISTLETLIPVGTKIFIETDSKKQNDDGEILAYVWITSPDEDKLNSMVNYAILKSGAGKFVNEAPNIKYNRFFF